MIGGREIGQGDCCLLSNRREGERERERERMETTKNDETDKSGFYRRGIYFYLLLFPICFFEKHETMSWFGGGEKYKMVRWLLTVAGWQVVRSGCLVISTTLVY